MNRYIMLRRMRWPAILMLFGVIALLHQLGVVDHWIELFVPLLLILLGVLMLAERSLLAVDGYPPFPGQTPGGYSGAPYSAATDPLASAAQPPQQPGSAIVPANRDVDIDREGGQR